MACSVIISGIERDQENKACQTSAKVEGWNTVNIKLVCFMTNTEFRTHYGRNMLETQWKYQSSQASSDATVRAVKREMT